MTQTLERAQSAAASTQPTAAARPKRRRLLGVDAARGVSLLGMIMLHTLYEADPAGKPTWSFTLFSGRASAAFALLSGVGIALATGRRRVGLATCRPTAAALAARALAIGAIGLALGSADEVLNSVILSYLAVAFLLAIPLVFLPTWAIAAIGVTAATAVPALSHFVRPHLPPPSLGNVTFGFLLDRPVDLLTELSITGFYPAVPWMSYVCVGLVIGRLDLTRVKVAAGLLTTGTVLAVGSSTASSLLLHRYGGLAQIWAAQPGSDLTVAGTTALLTFGGNGTTPTSTWWWLAIDGRHTGTPIDLLATTGIAMALLGVMLLASHLTRGPLRWLVTAVQAPLAAVGTMTLSFYSAHILFINSDYDTYTAATGCLVQVVAIVLLGPAWYATVGRGPLETFVVSMTSRARRWATPRRPPSALGSNDTTAAKNDGDSRNTSGELAGTRRA